jgi:hypothetical protein
MDAHLQWIEHYLTTTSVKYNADINGIFSIMSTEHWQVPISREEYALDGGLLTIRPD